MDFQGRFEKYKSLIDDGLRSCVDGKTPKSLYEPTAYVLQGGGKRIRGVLVMLASEVVGRDGIEALDAAIAVEILHNFTLVHDDIMDNADTRRGRATVHTKWDQGTAILVGDVMIGIAQQLLLNVETKRRGEISDAFARGIIDVCEGQAMDRDYETRVDLAIPEYISMIKMKTGRLAEMAAEIGGQIGEGNTEQIETLRSYATNLGLAFQIQDDLLDIIADELALGKRIGKDIEEGKRTYLVVKAIEEGLADRSQLFQRFLDSSGLSTEHVQEMRALFEHNGIIDDAKEAVEMYIQRSRDALSALPTSPEREMLDWFAHMVMNRKS